MSVHADALMKDIHRALLYLAVKAASLCHRGGVHVVMAENLPAQTATDRPATWPPTRAAPNAERAVVVRLVRVRVESSDVKFAKDFCVGQSDDRCNCRCAEEVSHQKHQPEVPSMLRLR